MTSRPAPSNLRVTTEADVAPPAAETPPAPPRSRAPLVFGGLIGAFAVAGGVYYALTAGRETTDDAFVEAHVSNVTARIAGQVARVNVKDNQLVKAGDVLVELDDRDTRVKLASAKADLESARAQQAAMEAQLTLTIKQSMAIVRQAQGGVKQAHAFTSTSDATVAQARADLVAAESRLHLADVELKRSQRLHAEGATSAADLDVRQSAYDTALASVEQARARLVSAQAGIANASGNIETAQGRLLAAFTGPAQIEAARAQVGVAKARVAQAQAALEQAELNLSYTKVLAPRAGVISRRTVEPGQNVDPSRPILAITSLDDVWVVANFKEDQLARMTAGQPAKVTIDTFRGRTFAAHVDSLAGGTGSRFALLPPDNASGNFTKVVQRVPVLVRIDGDPGVQLRPGMSAWVSVTTN